MIRKQFIEKNYFSIFTLLIFFIILFFYTFNKNTSQFLPDVDLSTFSIDYSCNNMSILNSRYDVFNLVEKEIKLLNDVKDYNSYIINGGGGIYITFHRFKTYTNSEISNKLENIMRKVKSSIKWDIKYKIKHYDTSSYIPVFTYIVHSKEDNGTDNLYNSTRIIGESILDNISMISQVKYSNNVYKKINYNLDYLKFYTQNVPFQLVLDAFRNAKFYFDQYTNNIKLNNSLFSLYDMDRIEDITDLNNHYFYNFNKKIVYFSDLGDFKYSYENPKENSKYYYNKLQAIKISVYRSSSNFDLIKCDGYIDDLISDLYKNNKIDKNIRIHKIDSKVKKVKSRIKFLRNNIIQSFIIIFVFITLSIGILQGFIATLSIPFTMMLSSIMFYFLDITYNVISLFGFIVVLGLIVDGAIVLLESITRNYKNINYSSKFKAIELAMHEVGSAIILSCITTIIAFLPLFFINSTRMAFFYVISKVVIIALFSVIIFDHFIVPLLFIYILPFNANTNKSSYSYNFNIEYFLKRLYKNTLYILLRFKYLFLILLFAFIFICFIKLIKIPTQLFNSPDSNIVSFNFKYNPNFSNGRDIINKLSDILNLYNIKSNYSSKYHDKKFNIINKYLLQLSKNNNYINGKIYLKDLEDIKINLDKFNIQIYNDIYRQTNYKIYLKKKSISSGNTGGAGRNDNSGSNSILEYSIEGPDIIILDDISNKIDSYISKLNYVIIDDTNKVNSGTYEFVIKFNKEKILKLGIKEYNQTLFAFMAPYNLERDIMLKNISIPLVMNFKHKNNIDEILNLPFFSNTLRKNVPLSSIANISYKPVNRNQSPDIIDLLNGVRYINKTIVIKPGNDLIKVSNELDKIIGSIPLPPKYFIKNSSNDDKEKSELFRDIIISAILLVLFIYLLIAIQLQSFTKPLIVIISLVFMIPGVYIILYITGYNLSVLVGFALISLFGIVINDTIVLVTYIGLKVDSILNKDSLLDVIVQSSVDKLPAILITTITTFLSFLPMILFAGNDLKIFVPLSMTMISGLVSSTILIIFVVPILYMFFAKLDIYLYNLLFKKIPSFFKQ